MKRRQTRRRRREAGYLPRVLYFGFLASLAAVACAALALLYFSWKLPSVESLKEYKPPQVTKILDVKRRVIGELYSERRTVVPMSQIPKTMIWSAMAAEDAEFYQHQGLDFSALLRAFLRDVLARKARQGGSTITQQTVKLILLNPERTISRKIRELILARRLEKELSKDEILHLYLNHVYFGEGRYGVQEAARFYFNKDCSKLNLAEAALLAGIIQAPTRLSPLNDPDASKQRQLYVLDQLEKNRQQFWPELSEEEVAAARKMQVHISAHSEEQVAPELVYMVQQELRKLVGEEVLGHGGFEVETTLDLDVQKAARAALQRDLNNLDQRQGYMLSAKRKSTQKPDKDVSELRTGKTYWAEVSSVQCEPTEVLLKVGSVVAKLDPASTKRYLDSKTDLCKAVAVKQVLPVSLLNAEEPPLMRLELGPEGAVVVIDASSRAVRALVGAYEASTGFNRAYQALRQPGSTFKTLVYAYGIHARRYTPASIVLDAPASYAQWQPHNHETWTYRGAVRLRQALALSINLVAVRVMESLGPHEVASFAHAMGIKSELDPTLALALGASSVTPLELTNAYATLAAGGQYQAPRWIRRIVDPDGNSVPLGASANSSYAMEPSEAYVTTNMLRSVVTEGTGASASALGKPIAGKTGTSDRARDAWFVGYSPTTVVGVWVGFDDRRPLGAHESGASAALPAWMNTMRAADITPEGTDFAVPIGVVSVQIDPTTGLLALPGQADAMNEVFVSGTEPTEMARPPDVDDPNTFLMDQASGE